MPLTALQWPFPWHFESGPSGSRSILVASQGGNAIAYTVGGDDSLGIEALSVDVDGIAAVNDVLVEAALSDQSGALLARVRTGTGITSGFAGQATFAPQLPDTSTFTFAFPNAQIQAGLWDVEAEPLATITVTALEPAALVTQLRILCFNVQGPSGDVSKPDLVYTWGG